MTIRRIDPWSILKFGFVANLVLLGIQLLAGAVVWYVVVRLELIETVCELAATVGFTECGVDGGALFDSALVLGLLGVVIQTGILVFLAFLANLIFDLTGGIGLTLESANAAPARSGGVVASARAAGAAAATAARQAASERAQQRATSSQDTGPVAQDTGPVTQDAGPAAQADTTTQLPPARTSRSDDDTLFGDG